MDLKNPRLIYLKGALFALILVAASGVIVLQTHDWLAAAMVGLVAWSSARLYYFMFYVIEKHVDPGYRFAGVFSFLRYLARSRASKRGVRRDAGAT